jgi:hypothetical protein
VKYSSTSRSPFFVLTLAVLAVRIGDRDWRHPFSTPGMYMVERTQPGAVVPTTMDAEDRELLKLIAEGTTQFRPVQDEPSDSPRWAKQVDRLRRLRDVGLIRMPEPKRDDDQPGYPSGVGPCELTPEGRDALRQVRR